MGINHARVYAELSQTRLAAVADVNKLKAKEVGKRFNADWYTDYKDLIYRQDIDAVSICVPTNLHAKVAINAMNSNKHVLLEKPIATMLPDAIKIVRKAKSNKVKLMIGHIERFNPVIIKLKKIIDQGVLGKVVSASAKRVGPFPPAIRYDVGVILDLATHDIDVLNFLIQNEVKKVYAEAQPKKSEDLANILLKFENNAIGYIEVNWLTPRKVRQLTAVGLKGVALCDYITQELTVWDPEKIVKYEVDKTEPLKNELQSFADCIIKNNEPPISGEMGIKVLTIALAAIKSKRIGKPILIS